MTVRAPRGTRIVSRSATLAGKRIATKRKGRRVTTVARLLGLPRHAVHLVVRVKLSNGRTIISRRTYHPCQHRA